MNNKLKIVIFTFTGIILHFCHLFSQGTGNLSSASGTIYNSGGTITIKGVAKIGQDTILGTVEYSSKANVQPIQSMVYENIRLVGTSEKFMADTVTHLVAMKKFYSDTNSVLIMNTKDTINVEGETHHNAVINPISPTGRVIMSGNVAQSVHGKGVFKEVELNDPSGTTVIKSGGFKISTVLELRQGQFRNSKDSNFVMDTSTHVIRHVGASISYQPVYLGKMNLTYTGTGSIVTGAEVPTDSTKIQRMIAQNTDSLVLSTNMTVNDSLINSTVIFTEPNDSNRNILTLTSTNDPIYLGKDAEVDGSVRRTNILTNNTPVLFNNKYTYALFSDPASAGQAKQIQFRIKQRTFPLFANGNQKVKRPFTITGYDASGQKLSDIAQMKVGYGWRNSSAVKNETNGLKIDVLKFQKWDSASALWSTIVSSTVPIVDTTNEWASANAVITKFGDYAIGLQTSQFIAMSGKVFLEGPFRDGGLMISTLRDNSLLPHTPPNVYPYNLDSNRLNINVVTFPDSVVDWVLLAFRQNLGDSTKDLFKTCFVKRDGTLIDLNGSTNLILGMINPDGTSSGIGSVNSGTHYIAVMHRNHLSIVTEDPYKLSYNDTTLALNFTNYNILLGRKSGNAIKQIGYDVNQKPLFGMIAGDVNQDGYIKYDDLGRIWNLLDFEGYVPEDINQSIFINTVDFNYSQNNLGKVSNFNPLPARKN
ncbi:MAG: hypothetical protein NT007_11705 [Candidatus Kapabacteria bacterium]|nr:hypothetical protein [Candidatus Kapabacteria bacterium]